MKTFIALALLALLPLPTTWAQAPGVPIESNAPLLKNVPLLEKAKALREGGKLPLNIAKVKEQLAAPVPVELKLPEPAKTALTGREIAQRARAAYLRIGWYYLCPHCDNWHVNLAGGYAIARDAAVTCHHCVKPGDDMREGYLIAVDSHGEVLPVVSISAKSETLDAAILHLQGGDYQLLALDENVAPGDAAYCFSEPMGQHGYFSQGIVNRFYWKDEPEANPAQPADAWKHLRVNVSTDWAPGSSGSAVLDQCGNVIGHVSTISPMGPRPQPMVRPNPAPATIQSKDGAKSADAAKTPMPPRERSESGTFITLHEAVPARGVRALATARPAAPVVAPASEKSSASVGGK